MGVILLVYDCLLFNCYSNRKITCAIIIVYFVFFLFLPSFQLVKNVHSKSKRRWRLSTLLRVLPFFLWNFWVCGSSMRASHKTKLDSIDSLLSMAKSKWVSLIIRGTMMKASYYNILWSSLPQGRKKRILATSYYIQNKNNSLARSSTT